MNLKSFEVEPNFLVICSLASIHFEFCFKHMNPCFTLLYNQMLSFAIGLNFHTFCHHQQQAHFFHYSLIDQLYAKNVYFCSFATKFNQASNKYSRYVFNSFYRTVTHEGPSHRIFKSPSHAAFPHVSL